MNGGTDHPPPFKRPSTPLPKPPKGILRASTFGLAPRAHMKTVRWSVTTANHTRSSSRKRLARKNRKARREEQQQAAEASSEDEYPTQPAPFMNHKERVDTELPAFLRGADPAPPPNGFQPKSHDLPSFLLPNPNKLNSDSREPGSSSAGPGDSGSGPVLPKPSVSPAKDPREPPASREHPVPGPMNGSWPPNDGGGGGAPGFLRLPGAANGGASQADPPAVANPGPYQSGDQPPFDANRRNQARPDPANPSNPPLPHAPAVAKRPPDPATEPLAQEKPPRPSDSSSDSDPEEEERAFQQELQRQRQLQQQARLPGGGPPFPRPAGPPGGGGGMWNKLSANGIPLWQDRGLPFHFLDDSAIDMLSQEIKFNQPESSPSSAEPPAVARMGSPPLNHVDPFEEEGLEEEGRRRGPDGRGDQTDEAVLAFLKSSALYHHLPDGGGGGGPSLNNLPDSLDDPLPRALHFVETGSKAELLRALGSLDASEIRGILRCGLGTVKKERLRFFEKLSGARRNAHASVDESGRQE